MKSISKRKKTAHKPTLYRVLISGTRVNSIAARKMPVSQTYELPGQLLHDSLHAEREALRIATREHPAWNDLKATTLA